MPIGPGAILLVVGPSGAGKDTLIAHARSFLKDETRVLFPTRIVTRASDASEAVATVTTAEFETLAREGRFALSWSAHGLGYALATSIDDEIEKGVVVVANVSRSVIPAARERYRHCCVALIDALPAARALRLSQRKRESLGEVESRLAREVDQIALRESDLMIVNDRSPQEGGDELVRAITALLGTTPEALPPQSHRSVK